MDLLPFHAVALNYTEGEDLASESSGSHSDTYTTYGAWRRVVWKEVIDVSEEFTTSIFRNKKC
jgi:hypothetical protein